MTDLRMQRLEGKIVFATVGAHGTGWASVERCVYGTAKAAVIGLTESVATDYVEQGNRCNAICTVTVDSPSLHERLRATSDYENAWKEFNARQKMGRIGTTQEIAALACYLASVEASFTTGQTLSIDGGWTI